MSRPLSQHDLSTVALEELESSDAKQLRVLVVRMSAMGDVIHGLPAIAALRAARPNWQVGWLIEQRWIELLCADSDATAATAVGTEAARRLGACLRFQGMAQGLVVSGNLA